MERDERSALGIDDLGFLDAVTDVVIAADPAGIVIHANAALKGLLGWSPADLVGQSLKVIVPDHLRERHLAAFAEHMAKGTARITGGPPVILPARHHDGHEVEVELTLTDHRMPDGTTVSVGVLRDLSTDRQLEWTATIAQYHAVTAEVATEIALVNDVHTLSDASSVLLRALTKALRWDAAIFWLVAENGSARPADYWHSDALPEAFREMADPGLVTVPGRGLPGRVIKTRKPAWIEAVADDPSYFRRRTAGRLGITTTFAFPILRDDRVEGVVELMSREPVAVDAGLLTIVAEVGRRVGEFLHRRAAERDVARSDARKTAILMSAFDAIIGINHHGTVTDWNPAAERILGHATKDAVGRPLGDLIVPEDLRESHRQGLRRFLETRRPRILGQPLELRALHADGHEFPVELAITQLEGVEPPEFVGYLRDISERKAVEDALARSRDELFRVATTLQDSMLPATLPRIPGHDVGVAFRPAGDGAEIGGDFYDVFQLDDTRWAALIGDVRGKGVSAARLTALVRYTARAAAVEAHDPVQVLGLVNQAILAHEAEEPTFCTAVYVEVDLSRPGTLRLVRAGHPAPLRLAADGSVSPVGARGSLLGVLEEPSLTASEVDLAVGEVLVLYTDGLTEARTEHGMLGEDGLASMVSEVGGTSASVVADHLKRRTVELQGGRTSDDLAVLAIKRLATDS